MSPTSLSVDPQQRQVARPKQITQRARVRQTGLVLVFFFVGLFGTAGMINRWMPPLPVPTVQDKIDWMALHGDEYDTLFVGSSRTYHHIVPSLFDRLMAEAGRPTRSFNLGIDGMRSPEDTFLLEKVLASRRTSLKFVVIESNPIEIHNGRGNDHGTLRVLYWHDLKRSMAVFRSIVQENFLNRRRLSIRSFLRIVDAMQYNLGQFLAKTLHSGRGLELLEARLGRGVETPFCEKQKTYDGYVYDTPLRQITEDDWAAMQTKMQKSQGVAVNLDLRTKASQLELVEKRQLIESFGGQMITFNPPLVTDKVFVPDPAILPSVRNINFSNSGLYPDLFKKEYRADGGHLNQIGAEIFTRLLVEKIVAAK